MDLIKVAEQAFAGGKAAEFPEFKAGDTITVTYRIKEGDKERDQKFRGVVIQMKGADPFTKTFTVRARIFYLRDLTGKKARIKERVYKATENE